jgi:hypothetical protein
MLSTQSEPLPPCYTLYRLYRPVLIYTGKGGGVEVNWREGIGAVVPIRGVENTNMTDCISRNTSVPRRLFITALQ